jgi:hypothetical protein
LGVLLAFAGMELALVCRDQTSRTDAFAMLLTTAACMGLQYRGYRHPHKVRQLSHGDPAVMLPDRHRRPDDRAPHDQNVHRRQRQVPHPELNRGEDQVGHEIDGEGQGHQPRHRLSDRLHEHEPEADEDDRVQNLPDQANGHRAGVQLGLESELYQSSHVIGVPRFRS